MFDSLMFESLVALFAQVLTKSLKRQRTLESPDNALRGSDLEKQVDELVDTFNEIAQMLGKENVSRTDAKTDIKVCCAFSCCFQR